VVAALVLLLYVGGARDYVLILIGDTDYIRVQFGPAGVAYFTDYPPLPRVLWSINIAAGLVAPVLLLVRIRTSAVAAVIAAVAQALLLVVTFTTLDRAEALGPETAAFDIGVGVLTALFAAYAGWWARRTRATT
jgi:hypothetical protein